MKLLLLLLSLSIIGLTARLFAEGPEGLLDGLVFHAPFDGGADANLSAGDGRIYTAPPSRDPTEGKPGLNTGEVTIGSGKGRYGDALHFLKKTRNMVFFHGDKNMGYRAKDWSGTISMWLSIDPADLEQEFSDPVQITDKKYNDAALWVDFTKDDAPPHFRMGVFADANVWKSKGRKQDEIPRIGAAHRPSQATTVRSRQVDSRSHDILWLQHGRHWRNSEPLHQRGLSGNSEGSPSGVYVGPFEGDHPRRPRIRRAH